MKFDFETAIDLQFYWYANSYEFFLQHRLLHAITQSYGPAALWLDNNGGIHSLFGHKIITMDNPPTVFVESFNTGAFVSNFSNPHNSS